MPTLGMGERMMKMILIRTAAAILAAVLLYPCNTLAVSAEKAVVMDAATGRLLYEKSADKQSLIASTTKIMTALIVCEQCNVLDRMRIPKEAVGIEGSSIYLRTGEYLSVRELLYGLMLRSGNESAVAIAIIISGSVEKFVELMNEFCNELGLSNTNIVTVNGLHDDNHYTTAFDLAKATSYALKNSVFAEIVKTKEKIISGEKTKEGYRFLKNKNKLLN